MKIPSGTMMIVDVPEHRDEVGNEIDRAERVGRNRRGGELHIPGHTCVATRDVQGDDVPLNGARPLL
jgi:hypothetical protein